MTMLESAYEGDPIRPPAEAGSTIVQLTIGCPHQRCTFCGAYRHTRYRVRPPIEFRQHVATVARFARGEGGRVFFADGDAMVLPTERLLDAIAITREIVPEARRFSIYAGARGILAKTADELAALKSAGLNTFYLGLESGDEELLRQRGKGSTAAEMIEAVRRAQTVGLRASVMVLLGLGGTVGSRAHARATAAALNAMQPRLLSCLTLMLVPGTPLHAEATAGGFTLPDARGILQELRELVAGLSLARTVFTANHASSWLPLEGALPRDRDRLLAQIGAACAGAVPLTPAFLRGL
jgi:radical SAM superfamily enzyme YgiQ (UPF0313 family)